MEPFNASAPLDPLTNAYPASDTLLHAIAISDANVRYALARLWLSEGIPFAFKTRPGIYEHIRAWLARRLEVQSKEVTLIGSGRHGCSLSAGSGLGVMFGCHSDLDLTVVSVSLFTRLSDCFHAWTEDYARGDVRPANERERKFWDYNNRYCPANLESGFIDPYKIPNRKQYLAVQAVAQSLPPRQNSCRPDRIDKQGAMMRERIG